MIVAAFLIGPTITLAFVGDVMLGRRAELDLKAAKVVRAADWAFGNLECAITNAPVARRKLVGLRAEPKRASWLTDLGLDCVSIANNHTSDCGVQGLNETLDLLRERGVGAAGLKGKSVIQKVRGRSIGVLAFTDFPRDALDSVSIADPTDISNAVHDLRPKCDLLVVSFHWGVEGTTIPSGRQIHFAKVAAEAGADVVVGHGPHRVQPVVRIGKTLVAYSLGDFVFDRKGERVIWILTWQASNVSQRLTSIGFNTSHRP